MSEAPRSPTPEELEENQRAMEEHAALLIEASYRTSLDGIPRRITPEGKIMKLDWELPEGVDDLEGEALDDHVRRLMDEQGG